jgi:hypothetical protein
MRGSLFGAILFLLLASPQAPAQQQELPAIVLPPYQGRASCTSVPAVDRQRLAAVAAKLAGVMEDQQAEIFKQQVRYLSRQSCPGDRLSAYFLRLLARDEFTVQRAW